MTQIFKVLLYSTLLFSISVHAQNDTAWNQYPVFYNHPFRSEKPGSFLKAEYYGLIDATSANNNILAPIAFKAPLSREIRSQNAERMDERNMAGSSVNAGISWYAMNKSAFKQDSLHWFFGYGYRDYTSTSFTKDMYKLLMIGNKSLEGDSADGSNFHLNRVRYDYLKAGMIKYLGKNHGNISVHVALARGIRFLEVETGRAMLYTAPYGTHINADVDLDARFNQEAKDHYFAFNGMGAFLGAEYNGIVAGGAITAGIDNLGFINWFNGRTFHKDTSAQYSGIYSPTFNFFEDNTDSVKNIFAPERTDRNFSAALPANIYVEYTFKLKTKGAVSLRVDHVFFGSAIPSLSATYYHFFKRSYSAATIQLGGFGTFNLCYDMGIKMNKNFVLLRLYGLEGMILPNQFGGIGAGLTYARSF